MYKNFLDRHKNLWGMVAMCGLKAKIRDSVEKTDDSTILERPVDIVQPEEAESHENEESAREYKKGYMITAGSTSESQDVATDESADFVCCSMVDLPQIFHLIQHILWGFP